MPYSYDLFGWYSGEVQNGRRSTPLPPPNLSQTTTPGQPRANWNGFTWAVVPYVTPPNIDEKRAQRRALIDAIQAERDRRNNTGVLSVNGRWISTSAETMALFALYASMGALLPANLAIRTLDGSRLNVTVARVTTIVADIVNYRKAVYDRCEALRDEIQAAVDLSLIDITAGWPATYTVTGDE